MSLEQQVKAYLDTNGIEYEDSSASYYELDFTLLNKNGTIAFAFDAKEKVQKINLANWPAFAPEPELFILDDLAVRKCLAHAPRSGVLVRDNLRGRLLFFSVADLALMPRKRVYRVIDRNRVAHKGKWLIDLRNGKPAASIEGAFGLFRQYLRDLDDIFFNIIDCYGEYVGEEIEQAGIVRRPEHWDNDVRITR